MGGSDNDNPLSLAIDAFGFLFVTGTFEGTVDFNPENTTTNLSSSGSTDIFLVKLNFSGDILFAKSFGGTGDDGATDVKIDANGNLLMTGYFSETVDFDPSNGTTNLSSLGFEKIVYIKTK